MSEDLGAVDGRGRLGLPTRSEACVEQLICIGLVIPNGDRRQPAQSCRIKDEHQIVGPADEDVMGEFVLHDDTQELESLAQSPADDVLQHVAATERCPQDRHARGIQVHAVVDRGRIHALSVRSRRPFAMSFHSQEGGVARHTAQASTSGASAHARQGSSSNALPSNATTSS